MFIYDSPCLKCEMRKTYKCAVSQKLSSAIHKSAFVSIALKALMGRGDRILLRLETYCGTDVSCSPEDDCDMAAFSSIMVD